MAKLTAEVVKRVFEGYNLSQKQIEDVIEMGEYFKSEAEFDYFIKKMKGFFQEEGG
jgi:hypothetical protein|tara:strand:+ start:327 stop:494 length:168 start_codon:yes stop_codon:yes gene_type:complete